MYIFPFRCLQQHILIRLITGGACKLNYFLRYDLCDNKITTLYGLNFMRFLIKDMLLCFYNQIINKITTTAAAFLYKHILLVISYIFQT
jgi:ribosome-associated toxin RatA of RatAB toxin-antitoxin module